jgi:lysyl endopeptidase
MDSFFARRQRQTGRLPLAIGLVVLLVSGAAAWARPPAGGDDAAAEAFGVAGPRLEKALKPVRPTPSEKYGIDFAIVPEMRLKAVDTDALLREDAKAEREGITKVLRFGVGRDLQLAARDGFWYDLPDGKRLWVGEVVSTDAIGLRLHFKDVRLPAGAELAVYAPLESDPARGLVKSGSPLFDPDRYVELYDAAGPIAKRGDFWTGSLFGDRTRIEYLAPAGTASDELPFAVDRLQHHYLDPVAKLARSQAGPKAAGPCHNDVACFPEWGDVSRAVSGIGFIGANSLFCTGQLLNVSGKADFTPYWLTANHCLDSQFDAESSEFFWLYQRATCGGTTPSITSVPRSRGATLISTNTQSDYTLLLVEGAIPAGDLVWSGWTSKEPANGVNAVAIHHPSGDHKRISFGVKEPVNECFSFPGFGGRKLVRTTWTTNAVTEPGSSGSGIFREDTGQLYGQLLGGPSFCGIQPEGLFDCYGSFATTFTKVKNFLKAGSDDKSEQNDTCPKARVVKTKGTFAGRIVKVLDEDWYKVSVKGGQIVNIDLSFANANGDVDLQAFGACNGEVAAESVGTTDGEGVRLQNVGNKPAFAFFRVFLANDTRNSYDLSITFE